LDPGVFGPRAAYGQAADGVPIDEVTWGKLQDLHGR
jgi:hypothetical protein